MAKRRHRTAWIIGTVVVIAAAGVALAKWPISTWGIFKGNPPIVPAGWVNYQNSDYGFSLSYPPDWKIFTGQLQNDVPAVLFGNPIEGTTTYTLRVSIAENSNGSSSAEYVADMLARAQAEDLANAKNGPAPQISVQFANASGSAMDNDQEYELNNVFEFDHNAEQIYAAHGNEMLIFDFPVADANPNIASSTENNAIAHEIVNTLTFIKKTGNKNGGSVSASMFDPFNATYTIDGQPVTLVDGKSEVAAAPGSASKVTTMLFGQPVMGDLNGDGKTDAALMLVQDSGGSGTFYYVAAAMNMGSTAQGTNAILLGDRIAPQTIAIQNGEILANYADRKPGEPMTTAPSVGVTKYFIYNGSSLVVTSSPK